MTDRNGPVLIEIDEDAAAPSPAEAPPVIDTDAPLPSGQAMQTMAALAARKPSALGRWFWRLLVTLIGFLLSVAAWTFVDDLLARSPVLGMVALVLIGLFVLVCVAILIREWAAIARLARLDKLHAGGGRGAGLERRGQAREVSSTAWLRFTPAGPTCAGGARSFRRGRARRSTQTRFWRWPRPSFCPARRRRPARDRGGGPAGRGRHGDGAHRASPTSSRR